MQPQQMNTGNTMPPIGFGTWKITPDQYAFEVTMEALRVGYRMLDTARIYQNEAGIGRAIHAAGIPREELFITTKLWNDDQGYEAAHKAFDQSLKRLNLYYVDLYLIHWPSSPFRLESWRALEELYKTGRSKAIGVSNYTEKHLRELLAHAEITPAVNQIEFHPSIFEAQMPIVEFCRQHNIVVQGYSPLLSGHMDHPTVLEVAERCGRSPAQVLLRWSVQHGVVPLPSSTNTEHMIQNLAIDGFRLKDADMALLDDINDEYRVAPNPYLMS
jgi:diketogulonate reductase-like aldo/keto reductase